MASRYGTGVNSRSRWEDEVHAALWWHLSAERKGALARAKTRLAKARIDGIEWYWPGDDPVRARPDARYDEARFLCPFDPVVWDRRRFELF